MSNKYFFLEINKIWKLPRPISGILTRFDNSIDGQFANDSNEDDDEDGGTFG